MIAEEVLYNYLQNLKRHRLERVMLREDMFLKQRLNTRSHERAGA